MDKHVEAILKEVMRRLTKIEKTLATLIKPKIGKWKDWAPTVTQSGSVTITIDFARYKLSADRTVEFRANINVTGTGTAANAVVIGGLPYAIRNVGGILGTIQILDTGTAYYVGALGVAGATSMAGRAHGLGSSIGITPNFALANGDEIAIEGKYER